MFKTNQEANSITFSFSSEMELVDRVIQSCREYLAKFKVSEFSRFRLVLRELLINAVEHGNWNDPERTVTCNIHYIGDWQFKIMVQDEGFGLDPDSLDMKLPDDPAQTRNRGYPLINAFTNRLEFNEEGNCVTAYVAIPQTTKFTITSENDRQVITPSGNLTASTADEFRELLVELLDQGHRKYCFDFIHVEDIDSVALSVMIIFAKMLQKQGGKSRLEIVNPRQGIADLFHLTRMDRTYKLRSEE